MAENNRNQSNQFNEDWDQNRNRFNQDDENFNRGRYGNTSYGNDYNQNQGMKGSYGNSPYKGESGRQEGIGGSYSSDYGNYGTTNYGRHRSEGMQGNWQGSDSQRNQYNDDDWNRTRGFGNQQNQGWEQRSSAGGYGSGFNTESDYGRRSDYGNKYDSSGGFGRSGYGEDGTLGGFNRTRGYDDRQNYGRNYGNTGSDRGRDWWDRTRDEVSSWFGDEEAERRRRMDERRDGGHKGKGPKDYRRSEDRIREDVCDRLSDDDRLDASDIQVQIQGDEVILSGRVNDREQKRRAEDLVERISGVRNVENRIRIGRTDDFGSRNYTGATNQTGGIGNESGTTSEILRNSGSTKK